MSPCYYLNEVLSLKGVYMETIALTSSVLVPLAAIFGGPFSFIYYKLWLYSEVGVVHGLPQSWRDSYSCANLLRGSNYSGTFFGCTVHRKAGDVGSLQL